MDWHEGRVLASAHHFTHEGGRHFLPVVVDLRLPIGSNTIDGLVFVFASTLLDLITFLSSTFLSLLFSFLYIFLV